MKVDEVLKGTQDAITVGRVYGEPIERDGALFIPAANVAGGGGGGGDTDGNGGVGFGIRATPAGAWVIRDGEITWQPALNLNRVILGGQIVAIVLFLALRAIFRRR
jgi:uncharacterized spore protein YtfJ